MGEVRRHPRSGIARKSRTVSITRLRFTGLRANGWSALITPIRSAGVDAASRMDHRHRLQITVKPYAYEDAATLLADFWQAVDAVLKERGAL